AAFARKGSAAGDDLDSSLIVPLVKRAEPEGQAAHLRCPGRKGTPPSPRSLPASSMSSTVSTWPARSAWCPAVTVRMQLDAGDLRPSATSPAAVPTADQGGGRPRGAEVFGRAGGLLRGPRACVLSRASWPRCPIG